MRILWKWLFYKRRYLCFFFGFLDILAVIFLVLYYCVLIVFGFPVERPDIEELFGKYGQLEEVKLMRGYGFVEFRDSTDAQDALDQLNGTDFRGERLELEFAKNKPRRDDYGRYGDRDRDREGDRDRDRDRGRYDRGPPRDLNRHGKPKTTSGGYRASISNLPDDASWQVGVNFFGIFNLYHFSDFVFF